MTTISKHISALIHLHDCVIVPGLGGFVANYKPAQVVAEQGLFLPPKKEIGFNRILTHNDGLLCDYISRMEGISYYDTQKRLEEYVAGVFGQLNNKLVVKVDEIGELKKDAAGNLLFIPNTSSLFLPEAYGLSSFHVKVPAGAANYDRRSQLPLPRNVFQRLSQRKLAASIAIFTGLFLLNTELNTPKSVATGSMMDFSSFAATVPVTSEATTEAVTLSETEAPVKEIETAPVVEQEVKQESAPVEVKAETKPLYYLIAASFPEMETALEFKTKMIDRGYKQTEIISISGKNRVAIEGYSSKEEAYNALSKYRQMEGFESAWLMKQK
jgi:hypothetical protein